MADESTTIDLFPLPLVLVPGELLPLQIFEERYRRLISRCRDSGGVFGIVAHEKDGVAGCGCMAAIYEVIEEFDDGRLNLVVEGRDRFRITRLVQPDAPETECLRGSVVLFGDESTDEDSDDIAVDASELFLRLVTLMGAEVAGVPAGDGPLSFRLAAAVDFGIALKQRLLEAVSEGDRLDLLVTVMRGLIPSLELRREREEAIRGNGKGH
jgi:Lon protease-like protein